MPDSQRSETKSDFVCDCKEWMRSACAGEPFYKVHEGKQYCVLHFPGKTKSTDFKEAIEGRLESKNFNFCGAWFPDEVLFENFYFSGDADFSGATFSAQAIFTEAEFKGDANFNLATFSAHVLFREATFSAGARFIQATFSGEAIFLEAHFSADAYFWGATFNEAAVFREAHFGVEARFGGATFNAAADFREAILKSFDLQFARIEKPHHVSFHTLTLRPHWFVNVNSRAFDFTNVDWELLNIHEEIESLNRKGVSSPSRLLSIACRHLAVNAEENHRYEEASKFRYMAMDARRLETRRGFAFWRLSWWYWLASGYGERVSQAFLVLVGIWFVTGLLYTRLGFARWEPKLASESDVVTAKRDDVGAPLKFSRALTYSAAVMTLQKPEPRPATTAAQTIVLLETVLGPVQAALLALAIRRKFMR